MSSYCRTLRKGKFKINRKVLRRKKKKKSGGDSQEGYLSPLKGEFSKEESTSYSRTLTKQIRGSMT